MIAIPKEVCGDPGVAINPALSAIDVALKYVN